MFKKVIVGLALSASLFVSNFALCEEKDSVFLPFYFSTETLGNTLGVAGVMKGVGQPQAALFGAALYTDKQSYVTFLSAFNYSLSDQLLVSSQLYKAQFNENPYYIGDQGNNDSVASDKTLTNGLEQNYEVEFKYLLPWGNVAENGLLGVFQPIRDVNFASPLESGVSSIIITPFYSSRRLDINNTTEKATGFELILDWDNRDSVRNPSKGSHTAFTTTVGSQSWQSEELWTKVEFQNSQYFALGPLGDLFDQQVLAFDFYTADTPNWNNERPPEQEQVSLGGLYRLRGYSSGRFHGRSAVHYSAEYRVIPDWQPLDDIPLINYYDLPWWQWVFFAEAGRVADQYDLKTLHTDMKWNLGAAVRFQVEGIVVRAEFAQGADEGTFRVMINQPF